VCAGLALLGPEHLAGLPGSDTDALFREVDAQHERRDREPVPGQHANHAIARGAAQAEAEERRKQDAVLVVAEVVERRRKPAHEQQLQEQRAERDDEQIGRAGSGQRLV
jgi:hypothetical protein